MTMGEAIAERTYNSILELLESRVTSFPDAPVIGIPESDLSFRKCTYSDLNDASSRLANHLLSTGLVPLRPDENMTSMMSVALLAPSSFEYAITQIGLLKLGYTCVFLSPLNSVPALVHLLKATSSIYLLAHPTQQEAAREAVETAQSEGYMCKVVEQPSKDAWDTPDTPAPHIHSRLTPEQAAPLPAFVIHSSGSTGHPKPIFITHKAACENYAKNFNTRGFTTLPLYHNHGLSCFWRAIHSRKMLYLYPSDIPLTTQNIKQVLRKIPDVEAFYAVPYVLKLLGDSEEGIDLLKRFKLVTFAGSPCPEGLGDKLAKENGINLVAHYGCTEMGQLMTSMRDFTTDSEWNYVRSTGEGGKNVNKYIRFEPVAEGVYELVVLDGWPTKVMTNRPDGSYATKDLFVTHPTMPDAYKYIGRLDDTLVMVNGEKTNPIPMEGTIKAESKFISEAVVFGAGRPQTGALLIPSDEGNTIPPNELLPVIWPAIEIANASAPAHSRLLPEMLVFLPPNTALPRTDKGTFVRARTYAAFAEEIELAYKRFEDGETVADVLSGVTDGDKRREKRKKLERDVLVGFVKETVMSAFGPKKKPLGDDDDLFVFGVDSLQAARIRQIFQRDLDLNGFKLPFNFVFENPSVNRIADYLLAVQSGQSGDDAETKEARQLALMTDLVSKYNRFVEIPEKSLNSAVNGSSKPGEVVLLTGATGSLGAHLLDCFLKDSSVASVYCLCRAKDESNARQRINESLALRGLPALGQRPDEANRVFCLPAVLGEEDLGLGSALYEQLREKVSIIVHNAWAVNFNMGVDSFEAEHIRAVHNLINLAITARHGEPASFFFSSSVSAVFATKGDIVPEQVSHNPADAQAMGYARSKWVAEQLCEAASKTRRIRAEVFRIGQLVADTKNGIWNETEAIPLQIKSSQTIGVLPDLDESVSWLPVDLAAQACVELVLHPSTQRHVISDSGIVWHILNGTSTTWRDINAHLKSAGLSFKTVPRHEWIETLRNSDPDPKWNPTIKLLSFFEKKYDHDRTLMRASCVTDYTAAASPTIASVGPVSAGFVRKFVEAWKKSGFL